MEGLKWRRKRGNAGSETGGRRKEGGRGGREREIGVGRERGRKRERGVGREKGRKGKRGRGRERKRRVRGCVENAINTNTALCLPQS